MSHRLGRTDGAIGCACPLCTGQGETPGGLTSTAVRILAKLEILGASISVDHRDDLVGKPFLGLSKQTTLSPKLTGMSGTGGTRSIGGDENDHTYEKDKEDCVGCGHAPKPYWRNTASFGATASRYPPRGQTNKQKPTKHQRQHQEGRSSNERPPFIRKPTEDYPRECGDREHCCCKRKPLRTCPVPPNHGSQ